MNADHDQKKAEVRMQYPDFEIIDFHTHPFEADADNICSHKECCDMSEEHILRDLSAVGIRRFCGSVIRVGRDVRDYPTPWSMILAHNDAALRLRDRFWGRYIPGFHVHPGCVKESMEEIERMHRAGVNLIGELVPYLDEWGTGYDDPRLSGILDLAEEYRMVVSIHSMGEDEMDRMVRAHPRLTVVAAHPGEYGEFLRHMERMKFSENYYLDTSGYGIFRHGMLRHAIDLVGAERILFGSDYPTCNPAMYVGGVLLDPLLKDREKELIFAGNAKRLLGLH